MTLNNSKAIPKVNETCKTRITTFTEAQLKTLPNYLKFKILHRYRPFSLLLPSDMASLSSSR